MKRASFAFARSILAAAALTASIAACGGGDRQSAGENALASLDPAIRALGAQHYADFCADCHGADGAGQPDVYPPLPGSPELNGTKEDYIHFMMTLERKFPAAEEYPPTMGKVDYLPSEDLAALFTYVSYAYGDKPMDVATADIDAEFARLGL